MRRFGQTFLLDTIKTEKLGYDQTEYIRPTIPDDDVQIILYHDPPPVSSNHGTSK